MVDDLPDADLGFTELLSQFKTALGEIEDKREQNKVKYPLIDIYTAAFAMFFLQDSSLLEFQRRLDERTQRNNLSSVFGVSAIPSDSQLRDVIDDHDYTPILRFFDHCFELLRQNNQIGRFGVLDDFYLVALDGSEYFTSETIHCNKCLTKKTRDGVVRYHHQILQSALIHPKRSEVIPLAPEFIRNTDGTKKQDCERNAAKRSLKRIRDAHPGLRIIILGDGLYSNAPFIKELQEKRFSYLLTAKPKDHKSLYRDIEGLREGNLLDVRRTQHKDREYVYEWVNDVDLNGSINSPKVNFVQLSIITKGKTTYKNVWVTDLEITDSNVEELVVCARARWKIENEAFNTLKNHGYHLEHNFGHGQNNLSEAFFLLNLLAYFFHQIFQMTDCKYQAARDSFSARKEFWNCIRSSFRIFLIQSWNALLIRINGPPLPFPENGPLEVRLN